MGLGLPGSVVGGAIVATRARWLGLREAAKKSAAARQLYDRTAPARRRLARTPDVLRPSGVAQRGR